MSRAIRIALLAVIVVSIAWFVLDRLEQTGVSNSSIGADESAVDLESTSDELTMDSSPFASVEIEASDGAEPTGRDSGGEEHKDGSGLIERAAFLRRLDLSDIGRTAISDETHRRLVAALNDSPELLAQVLDEFRQSTDLERLERLSRVLGDIDDPAVMALVGEYVYSGDAALRRIGLDLLKRVQPSNAEARQLVSNLLSNQPDPAELIDTLTAAAQPGEVDDEARNLIADQIGFFADHGDPGIRSRSLDLLSRWSTSAAHTPVLLQGLADESDDVRRSAAYALVDHEDPSAEVVENLMQVSGNDGEDERLRRAAILALWSMPLSDEQKSWLEGVEKQLNQVPLTRSDEP